MLKALRSIALFSPALLLVAGLCQPLHAEEQQQQATGITPGICGLYYGLEGRSIILPDRGLIRLVDYCAVRESFAESVSQEGEVFWQAFLKAASPRALNFAQQTGRADVVAYGSTICPILEGGTSMTELRRLQVQGGLPVAFDAAVNVAAVNTYCPQFQTQIGRR